MLKLIVIFVILLILVVLLAIYLRSYQSQPLKAGGYQDDLTVAKQLIKKHSIKRDSSRVRNLLNKANNVVDLVNGMRKIDGHTYVSADRSSKLEYKKLSDYSYINIPSFSYTTDEVINSDFEDRLNTMVEKSLESKGIIIDLRNNSGGNMWPMVRGLRKLLPSGAITGWDYGDKKQWLSIDGESSPPEEPTIKTPPIYVIVGSETASSGEITAISLLANPSADIYGEKTTGMLSMNESFPLPSGNILNLTAAYILNPRSKETILEIKPLPIPEKIKSVLNESY